MRQYALGRNDFHGGDLMEFGEVLRVDRSRKRLKQIRMGSHVGNPRADHEGRSGRVTSDGRIVTTSGIAIDRNKLAVRSQSDNCHCLNLNFQTGNRQFGGPHGS